MDWHELLVINAVQQDEVDEMITRVYDTKTVKLKKTLVTVKQRRWNGDSRRSIRAMLSAH